MLSVEDRLEVNDLYAHYTHCVDTGDYAGWVDCFTPDGYLAVPVNKIHVQGPEQLEDFARKYYKRSGGLERHLITNITVVADGDGARGISYLTMLVGGSGANPPRFTTTATYQDRLVRTERGWRFSGRDLHVDVRPGE
jgi:3-phenylpropionate/cinnamic acid dioxygenase small subunit